MGHRDDDLNTVRCAIDAMGELDIGKVLELLADDFVLELPFRDVVVHGQIPSGEVVATAFPG